MKIHIYKIPNWVEKILAVISFLLVGIGTCSESLGIPELIENILIITGFSFLLIYQSRVWWFKNYVEWNKEQILIKLKTQKSIRLKYKHLLSSILQKNKWIIKFKNGEILEISIEDLERADIQKLHFILMENIIHKL